VRSTSATNVRDERIGISTDERKAAILLLTYRIEMKYIFTLLLVCAVLACLAQDATKGKVLVFEKFSKEGNRSLYTFKDEQGTVFLADTIENKQAYKYQLSWPMYIGTSFKVVLADHPQKTNAQRILSLIYVRGPLGSDADEESDGED